MEKLYSLELTEKEILLCSYCIYAEFGQDNADWVVDGIDCKKLRKKLKGFICTK